MDDTFVIHKEVNKQDFLQHINSVDPAIRFTVEDNKEDGFIPLKVKVKVMDLYSTFQMGYALPKALYM